MHQLDDVLIPWNRGLLTVLPAGTAPSDLGQLLGSKNTEALWAQLRARFDMVVIDGDRMRMFSAQECRAAMGFPADYKLPTQHRLAVHMLGNAVCPPAARDVILALKEAA